MKDKENNEVIKIVLIGEASVGKTSIIYQFIDKIFQEDLQSTIGGTFNSKSIKCNNNKTLNLEIWDTAGQERYRCVITSKSSFEELKNYWVEQVLEASPKNIMLVIVANKSDLIDNEQVDEEEARNYAKKVNADFFVISAKENNSVNELFKSISKKYSGANSVEVIEENDDIMSFRKIRKESVRVTKAFTKKKKVGCC